jgi:hypothetical protein
MNLESTAFHIFGAFGRAIGRVILWFFILLIVGFGAVEGYVHFFVSHPATVFDHIGAAALGLVLGYAAALTVIVREVAGALIGVVREIRKIGTEGETDVGKIVSRLEGAISGKK